MKKNKIKMLIAAIILIAVVTTSSSYSIQYYVTKNKLNESTNQIVAIKDELEYSQQTLKTTQDELAITQENLAVEIEKSQGLSASLGNMSKELEVANTTIADLKSSEYELVYMGDFKISHYCAEIREHICGTGTGKTATGTTATVGRTIAVDPSVIPYGTQVYIEGYGFRIAEDCGGGVNGRQIDMLVNTHSEATTLGFKYEGVWLLVKKS